MLVASSGLVMQKQLKLCAGRSQADNRTIDKIYFKTNKKNCLVP